MFPGKRITCSIVLRDRERGLREPLYAVTRRAVDDLSTERRFTIVRIAVTVRARSKWRILSREIRSVATAARDRAVLAGQRIARQRVIELASVDDVEPARHVALSASR
jgi:hypothetical protein